MRDWLETKNGGTSERARNDDASQADSVGATGASIDATRAAAASVSAAASDRAASICWPRRTRLRAAGRRRNVVAASTIRLRCASVCDDAAHRTRLHAGGARACAPRTSRPAVVASWTSSRVAWHRRVGRACIGVARAVSQKTCSWSQGASLVRLAAIRLVAKRLEHRGRTATARGRACCGVEDFEPVIFISSRS